MGWDIRKKHDTFDYEEHYGGKANMFSAKLHHGGMFKNFPGRRYVQGTFVYIDWLDIDEFSVHEIDWMVRELGLFEENVRRYYHFQIPGKELDYGLVALGCDSDVRHLAQYVGENKVINFFIEQSKSSVDTYMKSPEPPRVVIEELPDEGGSVRNRNIRKKLVPRRRLLLEYGNANEVADEGRNTTKVADEVRNTTEVADEGVHANVVADEGRNTTKVADEVRNTTEVADEGVHANVVADEGYCADGVTFDDIDFSKEFPATEHGNVDEGSGEENECMGDNGDEGSAEDNGDEGSAEENECMGDNGHEGSGEESSTEGDDSQDNDYFYDKDNEVEDVDVDMRDFHDYVDPDEEYVGSHHSPNVHNIETVESDDDVVGGANLSYESFDSLTDEEMDDFETRRSQKLRELRHAAKKKNKGKNQLLEVTFEVGQTFGTAKEAKDLIRRHAIETRRELSFLRLCKQ